MTPWSLPASLAILALAAIVALELDRKLLRWIQQ